MRVAIITHYYGSINYGGNLQAYALCKVLRGMGYDALQLSYDRQADLNRQYSAARRLYWKLKTLPSSVSDRRIRKALEERKQAVLRFNRDAIPHTDTVYDMRTLASCVSEFDAFITGSDQVWSPGAYCPAYGLEFVPSGRTKLSYAASIAADRLPEGYRDTLLRALSDFTGISVREDSAVQMLSGAAPVPVQKTLDPTLLLDAEEWDSLCGERLVQQPYVFCYFLGDSEAQRKTAAAYARAHRCTLVAIPYLSGHDRACDRGFGDLALSGVSPEDFLSLIKHAEAVLTDSFHAVAFSCLYQKRFAAFERRAKTSMGNRIRSVTALFGAEERYCDTPDKQTLQYLERLPEIDYACAEQKIKIERERSIRFLKEHLANPHGRAWS